MTIRRTAVVLSTAATIFGLTVSGCATSEAHSSSSSGTSTVAPSGPAGGGTVPLALAMYPDITWKTWHDARLPFTDLGGPSHVNGDVATGFSHSPEGAILAMMQQQIRPTGPDDAVWVAAARQMAVVAPAESAPAVRIPTGIGVAGGLPLVAGFHWISYTPERAVSDLALQTSGGALSSLRVTEVWRDGDWKAELPARGGAARPLSGLGGYQPWPGTPR